MITLHSHFSRFFGMISNYGSGGAQTFSLSLFPIPSSDQPNDHWRNIIFIHVYVLKCMSVTITYESNEGSCNSPIYNKW